MIDFVNYLIDGALVGLLYALIAMGFVVIYRASKVFNFAQGELVVFGGFIVWWMVPSLGLPLSIGLPLAFVAAALFGLLVERVFFSRLAGESVFAMVMVTIGLLRILIRGLILVLFGPQVRPFPIIFPLQPVIIGDILRLVRALRQQVVNLDELANGFPAVSADADGAPGDAGTGGEEGHA